MPEIIIRDRDDTNGKIQLCINGNKRIIERMKPTKVTQAELDILMGSHEASFVIVSKTEILPNSTVTLLDIDEIEEINGDTGITIGADINSRGNEKSVGADSKLRGTGKGT